MSDTNSAIYEHPSPRKSLLPHLLPHLPYTINVVRRIQFFFQTPHFHALATFPLDTPVTLIPSTFTVCYVDRSRGPETEAWVFSSGEIRRGSLRFSPTEVLDPSPTTVNENIPFEELSEDEKSLRELERGQLRAIFHYIGTKLDLLPLQIEDNQEEYDRSILCVGSLSSYCIDLVQRVDPILNRRGDCYVKYLIPPPTQTSTGENEVPLPPDGLVWDKVRPEDHTLVLSRTDIPRKPRTLKLLPSVALRTTPSKPNELGVLQAWAFLGPDGSLSSLHVEPEYRNRGIGKLMTRSVTALLIDSTNVGTEGQDATGVPEQPAFEGVRRETAWCQSDVARGNAGSAAVSRGVGGIESWEVEWVWVDLKELAIQESSG